MPSRQKFGKGLRFCIVINELVCTFEDVKNIIHPLFSPTAYQHSGTRSGQCVRCAFACPLYAFPVESSAAYKCWAWPPIITSGGHTPIILDIQQSDIRDLC